MYFGVSVYKNSGNKIRSNQNRYNVGNHYYTHYKPKCYYQIKDKKRIKEAHKNNEFDEYYVKIVERYTKAVGEFNANKYIKI